MKIIEFVNEDKYINKFSSFSEQTRTFAKENIIPPALMKKLLKLSPQFLCKFWMIEDSSGRILGHIGANISNSIKNTGYVGFFELDMSHVDYQSVGETLLSLAKNWLRDHKAELIYGPLNYNTWFSYRFRVDDSPENYIWEPNQPREYIKIFANSGFKTAERYYSACTDRMDAFIKNNENKLDKCKKKGFNFSVVAPEELDSLLFELYKIAVKCFRTAVFYEPIDFPAFKSIYYPLAGRSQYFCIKVEDPYKKLAGYSIQFCSKGNLVLKNMAIEPQYQGQGLSTALMCFAKMLGRERGMRKTIYALFHEHNTKINHLVKKENHIWRHEYHLFKV